MGYTTLVLIVVSLISFWCFSVFSMKRNYFQDQYQIFKLYVWHFVVKRLELFFFGSFTDFSSNSAKLFDGLENVTNVSLALGVGILPQ